MAQVLPAALDDSAADRLSALFDRHYDRLYRLARRLAPTADAARDLVQDTFLRAARSERSIPYGARGEEAWFVRVLINVQRDEWRKASIRAHHAQTTPADARAAGDAEAELIARDAVWRALDTLTPRRRAVVVMHELEELSVAEIATLLGVTGVTVRWHLSRGRCELARVLGADSGERYENR